MQMPLIHRLMTLQDDILNVHSLVTFTVLNHIIYSYTSLPIHCYSIGRFHTRGRTKRLDGQIVLDEQIG